MARESFAWSAGLDKASEVARVEVQPRSVERAPAGQRWALNRLQKAELARRQAARAVDDYAVSAREAGLPWASIGWALGMSGQGAQKHYGKRVSSH